MIDIIIIVICVIIFIGASALAWWFENGPESKTDEKEKDLSGVSEER